MFGIFFPIGNFFYIIISIHVYTFFSKPPKMNKNNKKSTTNSTALACCNNSTSTAAAGSPGSPPSLGTMPMMKKTLTSLAVGGVAFIVLGTSVLVKADLRSMPVFFDTEMGNFLHLEPLFGVHFHAKTKWENS